jgi:hypothetical protein
MVQLGLESRCGLSIGRESSKGQLSQLKARVRRRLSVVLNGPFTEKLCDLLVSSVFLLWCLAFSNL